MLYLKVFNYKSNIEKTKLFIVWKDLLNLVYAFFLPSFKRFKNLNP